MEEEIRERILNTLKNFTIESMSLEQLKIYYELVEKIDKKSNKRKENKDELL